MVSEEKYLRLLADFDNLKKRRDGEISNSAFNAKKDIILKLIPIFDDIEIAIGCKKNDDGLWNILKKYYNMLSEIGIETYCRVGEEFDPEIHSAVMTSNDGYVDSGTITKVIKKGYKYNGEIIRHALVSVEI